MPALLAAIAAPVALVHPVEGAGHQDASDAVGGSNRCVERAELGDATVAWDRMKNPILSYPDAAVKDMSVRLADGRWRILFSYARGPEGRFDMGSVSSHDLVSFSRPQVVPALASPEITRDPDGTWLIAAQQYDQPKLAKLRILTTRDFETFSDRRPLAPELAPDADDPKQRVIDAALAHADAGLFLAYKQGDLVEQSPRIAHSPSGSPEGPWTVLGQPDVGLFENYQFFVLDGTWHMLGTTVPDVEELVEHLELLEQGMTGSENPPTHRPVLYRLAGDPDVPANWLRWEKVGEIEIPEERWNTFTGDGDYERSNSAHLCDARPLDGYFYLFYAGSTEVEAFGGTGHAKLGIARSKDLRTWELPPGEKAPTAAPTTPAARESAAQDDTSERSFPLTSVAAVVLGIIVLAMGALQVRRKVSPPPR